MRQDSIRGIKYNIAKYNEYWPKGLYFDAVTYLGQIYYYMKDNAALKRQYGEILKTAPITDDVLKQINFEAEKEKENLQKILTVGGEYVYEEMVLILTNRMSLFLAMSFLKKINGVVIPIDLNEVDEMICELYKDKKNRIPFKQGIDRIKSCYSYSPEIVDFLNNFSKCKPGRVRCAHS